MAYPATILDLQADLQLAGTWTSITSYLYSERAKPQITRGRPDETSQAVASSFTTQLNNRDNRFSSHNPGGAYYPSLTRNTPLRVHVPDSATYLRLEDDDSSDMSCPSSASLNLSADMQLRIDVQLSDWSASVLAAKWTATGVGSSSWAWLLNWDGTLGFAYTLDGSTVQQVTSTQPLPWPGGRITLIMKYTHTSGKIQFYWAPSINGSQTQIGANVTGASGAFNSGTATLRVGYNAYFAGLPGYSGTQSAGGLCASPPWAPLAYGGLNGKVYEFRMYNAASAGSLVANPVFSSQTPGTTSFADAQSNTWGIDGTATITNRKFRFHGEVGEWPPRWDPSGTDVYTAVQANGLLRRIGQQQANVSSALTRYWSMKTGTYAPVAYWPCEDGNGATGTTTNSVSGKPSQIASGLPNGQQMTITGNKTAWASNTSFLSTQALPVPGTATWSGFIPAYTPPASGAANVARFLVSVPSGGDTDGAILARMYTKGTVAQFDLQYGTTSGGSLRIFGYDTNGGQLFDSGYIAFAVNGVSFMAEMALTVSGGTVTAHINTLVLGAQFQLGATSTTSGSAGVATHILIAPTNANVQSAFGQIAVQSSYDTMDLAASADSVIGPFNAWAGEPAGIRFARLCTEQGYANHITGYPQTSAPMGPQSVSTFSSLLQEIEDADHGMVFEPRTALALGYRTSASLCNQGSGLAGLLPLALSYTAAVLGGGGGMAIEPTDDDLLTVNDVIVSRGGASYTGSSAEVVLTGDQYAATSALSVQAPPNGVGAYQDSQTVNVWSDSQLGGQGGWLVHLGTCAELRYPSVPVDLARSQLAGISDAVQNLDLGDYVQITSPPAWLSPDAAGAIIWGLTETLGGYIYTISFQTTPESVYETLLAGTGALGDYRADGEGSTVGTGFGSGSTSIRIATASPNPTWSIAAGDLPFDILIAGERMTVTAIDQVPSTQTFTVTRSVNGVVKSHSAGEAVTLFTPCYAALT